MKRLLLLVCLLGAVWPVSARRPAVHFDLPYSNEYGYYIVTLGTPVGERRFVFDTGATTSISASLCAEMGLTVRKKAILGDAAGNRAEVGQVRLDSLRMGALLFRDLPVNVLPDSSLVFCFPIDGIAGCDLLQKLAVRMPNADSTITLTDDVRTLNGLDKARAKKLLVLGKHPLIPVSCCSNEAYEDMYAVFDTGFPGFFQMPLPGDKTPPFLKNVRWSEGFDAGTGWTNRKIRNMQFRAVIPAFGIAGATIADMPVRQLSGQYSYIGNRIFDFGQVVLDFRHKRFWFLPRAEVLQAAPQPVLNIIPTVSEEKMVVGQVWDDTLTGIVKAGDRIISFDGVAWNGDRCDFYTRLVLKPGMVCEIETATGAHTFVTLEMMK